MSSLIYVNQNITICIPTYNRPDALERQLTSLMRQDLEKIYEIIILDNASNYDVHALLNKFNSDKVRLIRHKFNLGMGINVVMPMLFCESKWVWLLSDDDQISADAISVIGEQISIARPETGMIKFGRDGVVNRPCIVSTLEDYVDYYYFERSPRRGDVVFLSTCVLNLEVLNEHIPRGFEYSYSLLGFFIPVIMGLDKKQVQVTFCSSTLVKYCPPEDDGWCRLAGAEKISTIAHLPVSLRGLHRKRFLNILMPISWQYLVFRLIFRYDEFSRRSVLSSYFSTYRFYLPIHQRFIFLILYHSTAFSFGRLVGRSALRVFRSCKRVRV